MKWLAVFAVLAPGLLSAAEPSANALAELEARSGGRLGVVAQTASGRRLLAHREAERFAICSTFKLLLAAVVLERVERGQERLDRAVPFGEADLLEYAPAARENLAKGSMTVEALCRATVELSDNTAANLLLAGLGGPEGFTAAVRAWGDDVTRLDRNEPTLNENAPDDLRDTSTPGAMAATLARVLLGDALSAESRGKLIAWMEASPTGLTRLRAGFPKEWRAGDKTGTGERGATNDVAILWPPGSDPVIVTAYLSEASGDLAARAAILADVGRIVADSLRKPAP